MDNPFLEKTVEVKWSQLTPDLVKPGIEKALEEARKKVDAIGEERHLTFERIFLALEKATEDLDVAWQKVSHLDAVSNSPELRKAYNAMLPRVTEFRAKIPLNEKIWARLKAFVETPEGKNLKGIGARFRDETMADFREQGADLKGEEKARLEAISKELAQGTQKFHENVLDATNRFELIVGVEEKLEGLPERAREQARKDALKNGYGTEADPCWRFTLHAPSYLPAMKYIKDSGIRKELWKGSIEVGLEEPYNNTELIWKILSLREEKAHLLGKEHFADLILERRMAKSGRNALQFVEDLHEKVKKAFDRECFELEAYKAEKARGERAPLEPWETDYWAENLRREKYAFDEEALRPYFPIHQVVNGMFALAEKLFQVRLNDRATVVLKSRRKKGPFRFPDTIPPWVHPVEVWHPEVKFYEIRDEEDQLLGAFYTDWHPRKSKRGGGWMNSLLTGGPLSLEEFRGIALPEEGKGREDWGGQYPYPPLREPHLGVICGNLTPPADNNPALLTHGEVKTIFHEFGHLLHHLLGNVEIKSLNGIHVAWDFVELPSQIMENWCWERESLDFFARHYESGEPIPEELFQKMLEARNFHSARSAMRQLAFGKMDLELHMHYKNCRGKELDTLLDSLLETYRPPRKGVYPTNIRRFSHLFADSTGYAAGYYSYKWSEVLDADAFTRFKEAGILNSEVGCEFKDKILAKGNSEDPARLFRDFMGRDPDLNALLERSGLTD